PGGDGAITRLNMPGVTGVLTGIYMLPPVAVANWLAGPGGDGAITRLNMPGVTGVLTGIYMLPPVAVANW
ncbi:hypothetical protein CKF46_37700, partial [Klebsiella pneumoniae]